MSPDLTETSDENPQPVQDLEMLSVDQLIVKLKSGDKYEKSEVLGILVGKGAEVINPLSKVLPSLDEEAYEYAVEILGLICDPKAIPSLQIALKHTSKMIRLEAMRGLARFKDPDVLDPLLKLQKDDDVVCRRLATIALGYYKDSRVVDALIQALNDHDPSVRAWSSVCLVKIGDPQSVDFVIKALHKEEDPGTKASICRALWRFKDPKVLDPLFLCLTDPDPTLRQAASSALGYWGTTEARIRLRKYTDHETREIRFAAAAALGFMGDLKSEEKINEVWRENPPDWVKVRIARGLVLLRRDREALNFLLSRILDDSFPIGSAALNALGRIGNSETIGPIIEVLKQRQKRAYHHLAIEALEYISDISLGYNRTQWINWYEKEWMPKQKKGNNK